MTDESIRSRASSVGAGNVATRVLADTFKKVAESGELPSLGDRDSLLVQPLADSASAYVADDMAELTSDIEPKYANEINNCAANITHKTSEEVVNALLDAVEAWLQTKTEERETPDLAFFLKQIDTKALLERLQQYAKQELLELAKTLAIAALEIEEVVEQAETLKSDVEKAGDFASEIVEGDEQIHVPPIGKITIRIVFKNNAALGAMAELDQATSAVNDAVMGAMSGLSNMFSSRAQQPERPVDNASDGDGSSKTTAIIVPPEIAPPESAPETTGPCCGFYNPSA